MASFTYERRINLPVEKLWSILTDYSQLSFFQGAGNI